MECLALLLVLVVLGLLSAGVPFSRRGADRVWRELARSLNGVYVGGGLVASPTVHFRHGPAKVVLTVDRRRSWMSIPWPDAKVTGEVVTPGGMLHYSRFPPAATSSPRIDRNFQIYLPAGSELVGSLREGVLAQLERLRVLRSLGLLVSVQRGSLMVIKPVRLTALRDLLEFARTGLALHDELLLTRAEGIEFHGTALSLAQVRCQVCGDAIHDDVVYCRRCRTPHHRECWEYNGRCAVYGCGETEGGPWHPAD